MDKRVFDIFFSVLGILLTSWLLIIFFIAATIDTRQVGIYTQTRIGRYGNKFKIYKLRTICNTSIGEKRISALGYFLRRSKIDELPQLYNVLMNTMSFVGPRPDIKGYYDRLQGTDRRLLELKPGITGPASIKYSDEDALLSNMERADLYNDEVLFPDKVRINLNYLSHQSFRLDIKIIIYTILRKKLEEEYFN